MGTERDHPGGAPFSAIRPEAAAAPTDPVTLSPVDGVTLTTLIDNSPRDIAERPGASVSVRHVRRPAAYPQCARHRRGLGLSVARARFLALVTVTRARSAFAVAGSARGNEM
jgi:hypothetical protein